MNIKKWLSQLMQEIADRKVESSKEFLKWCKNDFNGNGISDYLE